MDEIGSALSLMAVFGFVAFLIWHREQSSQERRRQLLAERDKLLERIGSGEALTEFLKTDEGRRLLKALNEPDKRRKSGGLRMSVLGLTTAGVIAASLGVGFWYAATMTEPELLIPGAIVGSIGIGCLAAALLHYIFGKVWGMLKPEEEDGNSRRRLE